ncbi:MAG: DinB family protein [Flavobacteriaceae bacterium]|nr:DinB family protein [Flavobacteriaceae bacterium]
MEFELGKAIKILERTPTVLQTFLSDLPVEWTHSNEGKDTWSAFDIVGHLIHGEITDWIPRLKIILEYQDQKSFESFDRFAQFRNSEGKSLQDLLDEFSVLRIQNLTELKLLNLTDREMNLSGMHPELGSVTLKQLLATWVAHDLGHIAQISRVMAKQFQSEVGPWQKYISILNS